jgi:thiosulfate/3-mercaptopyruvate sulfurtransferase
MMNPLVDVATLQEMLASPRPPVVCDVRWALATGGDPDSYLSGHIPGAHFVHMEQDLSSTPGKNGRHPLPAPDTFAAAMRRVGVDADSVVVFYDDGPGMSAARAWWLLRYFGHADAYVLDGGLPAWKEAGFPISTDVTTVAPGSFVVAPSRVDTVDASEVLAAAENGVLLDARDLERYQGLVEPVDPVAGHIPGAVSAPTKENIGPDGRFLSPDALKARFAAVGVTSDEAVTVYCGSGVTAAHEILALAAAGYSAALYPGSWSHWITDESRPVATSKP